MPKVVLSVALVFSFAIKAQTKTIQLGDSLFVNGNYTKAIEAYKKYTNDDEVYEKIAKAYNAIGNLGEAVIFYKKAVEAYPNNALLKFEYGKLLYRIKKFDKASLVFDTLISIDSTNPNYYYQKGLVLEKLRDTLAIQKYILAYKLDQTYQKVIAKIARHYLVKRKHTLSHQYIGKGLESYPDNLQLLGFRAQNYYYQHYYDKAIASFNKLLDMGESSEFIHEKLSLSYAENSDYQKAIYHRKEALKFNPLDAKAMYVIGTYYNKLQYFDKAEEYIRKALNLMDQPLSQEYTQLGRMLNRQKKYEDAIKAFNKALKEDPKNTFTKLLILRTKDEYYADRKAVVKLYEDFINSTDEEGFKRFAEIRLKELKEENFMNTED